MRSLPGTRLPAPATRGIDALRKLRCLLQHDVFVPEYPPASLRTLFSDTDVSRSALASYLDELSDDPVVESVHTELARIEGASELIVPPRCLALYVLAREHRPETVVETGSYLGHSTTYILLALKHNGTGTLHSFDAHPHEVDWYPQLPSDFEPGYAVPDTLAERWHLHEGVIEETLEPALGEIGEIDLFFHDSDHSEAHKRFEYGLAQEHLSPSGVLASHDVGRGNVRDGNPPSYAFVDVADELDATVHATRQFDPESAERDIFAFVYT